MSSANPATNPIKKTDPTDSSPEMLGTDSDVNPQMQHTNTKLKKRKDTDATLRKKINHDPSVMAKETVTEIKQNCKVDSSRLKKYSDSSILPASTEHCPAFNFSFGQPRTIKALTTAVDIGARGYNVFAVGGQGLGKRTFTTQFLCQNGHKQAPLKDWVYAYNFNQPSSPIAIALACGKAKKLTSNLAHIWQQLVESLKRQQQNLNSRTANHYDQTAQSLRNTAAEQLAPLFEPLYQDFENNQKLLAFLQLMQQDLINNAALIAEAKNTHFVAPYDQPLPDRYNLNIISSPSSQPPLGYDLKQTIQQTPDGALILFEPNPTASNLLGKINQSLQAGYAISNHMMIKPGVLHQANGGYLLMEASHISEYPEVWHGLKLALRTSKLSLVETHQNEALGDNLLTPEPIPLEAKIILLGDADLYDQFAEEDAEFLSLFKIRADFHEEVVRSTQNEVAMVAKMTDIIAKYQLQHFDSSAQATILEFLSLQCEDQNKLSLHTDSLIQVMLEADRLAKVNEVKLVTSAHVKQALKDINYRSSYLKEIYLQEITDGQQLISTSDSAIGQINALTIIDYADSEFGMPALLTAVVQHSMGSGDILDIERDVELGGSLHAKGMLIMNSYLRALFSPYHPLNFTASLAFEQSYAHIDGDSATLAEACALLSALADVPISQALGITGSMNQLGRVQAVGGINSKVAGFFDACLHQGFTGHQGVILPHANISQLMLREDIIEAVKANQFHIYGVNSLSEALTILADMPVDTTTKKGRYRKSSLFGKIINNLRKWEEQLNPPEEMEEEAPQQEKKVAKKT